MHAVATVRAPVSHVRAIAGAAPVVAAALPAAALYLALTCPAGSVDALRAARVPGDLGALMAPGAGTSTVSAARLARVDHIGDLIASALTGAEIAA